MNSFGKRLLFAVSLGLLFAVPKAMAGGASDAKAAKPVKYKAAGQLTFITANFSYDGNAPAVVNQFNGKDNFGVFTGSCVAEYATGVTACTAPDGSVGVSFDLVESDCVTTYGLTGQIFSHAAAAKGVGCQSGNTGSQSQTVSYNIVGGTGSFASAAGTLTGALIAFTTAAPLGGDGGIFGGGAFSETGSVTK
jgi:hypothetical protein